ncbi:MAG: tRNA preQ1(34) S-adenosylmethionine ribosyltransferase-isomerase QueA [Gammaproteobacteria bacterium]
MRRSDFSYELPEELIAQSPLAERPASRLLVVDGALGSYRDARFRDLPGLLAPNDLLVLNDTRVIPARAYGRKATGGRVEMLVERISDDHTVTAQLKASKTPAVGGRIEFEGGASAQILERIEELWRLRFDRPVLSWLEAHGHVPLPPYIRRADAEPDRERYQTVYARTPGAVAAPTAGLHFDRSLLAAIQHMGVRLATVTLHVGAGTFQPVRVEDPRQHSLHEERVEVSLPVCEAVAETRRRGGRVIAVGTTVVRSLESAAADGRIEPFEGETELFILPGYRFRVVDALVTNFHLPESSLLMLVAAFAGRETVLAAYRHAVAERYRFFSYGDAMFVTPSPGARA